MSEQSDKEETREREERLDALKKDVEEWTGKRITALEAERDWLKVVQSMLPGGGRRKSSDIKNLKAHYMEQLQVEEFLP